MLGGRSQDWPVLRALALARRIVRDTAGAKPPEITIDIAPGVYVGTAGANPDKRYEAMPLLVNVHVKLRGATALRADEDGYPTRPNGNAETVLTRRLLARRAECCRTTLRVTADREDAIAITHPARHCENGLVASTDIGDCRLLNNRLFLNGELRPPNCPVPHGASPSCLPEPDSIRLER